MSHKSCVPLIPARPEVIPIQRPLTTEFSDTPCYKMRSAIPQYLKRVEVKVESNIVTPCGSKSCQELLVKLRSLNSALQPLSLSLISFSFAYFVHFIWAERTNKTRTMYKARRPALNRKAPRHNSCRDGQSVSFRKVGKQIPGVAEFDFPKRQTPRHPIQIPISVPRTRHTRITAIWLGHARPLFQLRNPRLSH